MGAFELVQPASTVMRLAQTSGSPVDLPPVRFMRSG
jgi:hypothetical protein